MSQKPSAAERTHAEDLLQFIERSPSPFHVVDTACRRLVAQNFSPLSESEPWALEPGQGYFVVCGETSLVAFRTGNTPPALGGFRILGAHTDSPGLRVKPRGLSTEGGLLRLGVEVYGSPLLPSFADRELFLAGRVILGKAGGPLESRLIRLDDTRLRLPNLAIHLNRTVNEEGLKFNKQDELPLILGQETVPTVGQAPLLELLAAELQTDPLNIATFDLAVAEAQSGCFWGLQDEFISAGRIDNQSSCHAALTALVNASADTATQVVALFDHEEVGSESTQGAGSVLLGRLLARISGESSEAMARAMARSFMISADAAHAFHPNFPGVYEPLHRVKVNEGPAVKINANQRYATDGLGAARFETAANRLGLKVQTYVHRSNLGCGSTIGPITAARLGIPVIDCGVPMWAMHSLRESAGVKDQLAFTRILETFLQEDWLASS